MRLDAPVAFRRADDDRLAVEVDDLLALRRRRGPYRLVPGDVIELRVPPAVRRFAADANGWRRRVDSAGNVSLPAVGRVKVAGRSAEEVAAKTALMYYPRHVRQWPAIEVRVIEHRTIRVSVAGAVDDPGRYDLRSDEASLRWALLKAGWIAEGGAAAIRVRRGRSGRSLSQTVAVVGLNVPWRDVGLLDGDVIEVRPGRADAVAVVGLVRCPRVVPCAPPPTLAEALARAGGPADGSAARYANVYRPDRAGAVQCAAVSLPCGAAAGLRLRPGDLVAVGRTPAEPARRVLVRIAGDGLPPAAPAARP
jgi:protein involved in polysaccharide export with SLBB domain